MPRRRIEEKKVGIRFSETMSGYLAEGAEDFEIGEQRGKEQNNALSFDVTVDVEDVSEFIEIEEREAKLQGSVSYRPLGQRLSIKDGAFGLFKPDPASGTRQLTYRFWFTAEDGSDYYLDGFKVVHDDPGFDILEDMTRLFTRIYKGRSRDGSLLGSGILTFHMTSLPSMLASFDVTNTLSPITKLQTISKFVKFCYGEVRETYVPGIVYDTQYENLVLSGKVQAANGEVRNFFFFSGVHDKDFPWGDDEIFWDVALILQRTDGTWERYALTDRVIEGLHLDVEEGRYKYDGPLYRLGEGYRLSKSELEKSTLPGHLRKIEASIELTFRPQEYPVVNVPFSQESNLKKIVPKEYRKRVDSWLSYLSGLGFHLKPFKVGVSDGRIALRDDSGQAAYTIRTGETLGEAEVSTIKNLRWPTLYYNYFCALEAGSDHIYVKVRSDVLRKNRIDVLKDKAEQMLGKVISRIAFLDLDIRGDEAKALGKDEGISFKMVDENLLEINNDHFPTATFQRRIVAMTDEQGKLYYALEEDMDPHLLRSIHSDKVARVAAIRDTDKFRALTSVLEATDFFATVERAQERSGKSKDSFAIIVKPNFMFMYSTLDPSTYTDPELVESLLERMFEKGYRNLAVAEARSTLGTFFANREVVHVADYIGLTGSTKSKGVKYRLIDLSEDLEEHQYAGKLGKHFVNRDWKNADFRISFAKNKTHVYAYYTLTIKNIYGALPMENKFREYHHERDIFSTTIEFIKHFPVHFGLIDATLSADGPFGVFADKEPNKTETIIGSQDLVAADWIGAEKMGLDPMVSDFVRQAVEAFGKPGIELVGDRSIYPGWENVPDVFPPFLFKGIDRYYYFGNLFYSIFAYMDSRFPYKDPSVARKFLRLLTDPITDLYFQKIKEGIFDRDLNHQVFELFTRPV